MEKRTNETALSKQTNTTYLSGFIYENNVLQFFGHGEGRIRYKQFIDDNNQPQTSYVYDYFIKDHLGNVRMVLTEEEKSDPYPAATMETAQAITEEALYVNLPETRTDKSSVPGYPTDNTTSPNDKIAKLSGSGQKMGPSIILKVMAGDKFNIKVSSWYKTNGASPNSPNSIATDLVTNLINSLTGEGGLVHGTVTQAQLQNSGVIPLSTTDFLNDQPDPGSLKPKAYLNWVLLDEQFKYVESSSGAEQVPDESEFGAVPNQHVYDHVKSNLPMEKNGYLYAYVSNETPNIDVFFDNLQVTHTHGPLLEETHYYPFGLTMAGISSKALNSASENRFKYNGKELQSKEFSDNSGLELYDFGARMQDPQLGIWRTVDPMANKMPSWSPYSAFFNNPLRFTDPTGMAPDDWYYWMSSEGKLMKREVKNSTNNVYLMNYDEKNPSNDKYVLINEFNPKSKGNNLLMTAFVGDLINDAGGSSLTKEYGFSPNYPDKEALAYSRSALGQIFLNTNRKMSSDYFDLLNSVSHEVGHLKLKDITLREHAGVYLYGFKDPSFSQSSPGHKIGTVRSFANYLYNIYDRENNSASIETISPLLDKFKKLNTGVSISYDFNGPTNRGGLNLYVNGSLIDYKPINEKTYKE